MKIALVWNADRSDLGHPVSGLGIRFEIYVEGLRQLGHEALVVCLEGTQIGAPYPTRTGRPGELDDPRFWRELGLDVAIAITHLRRVAMLEAIRAARTRVVAITDSDGRIGLHAHPWATIERGAVHLEGVRAHLGALKYFLARWQRGRRRDTEALEALASTSASDSVIFHSRLAVEAFRRLLRQHGVDGELAGRLRVVPYAVSEELRATPIERQRRDRVLAVGRWLDPQKAAPRLRTALARQLPRRPETEVLIYGRGTRQAFGSLADRHANLRLEGFRPPSELYKHLAKARAILFASRWETGPLAATEALALGATVIGPPLPNLVDLVENGSFGTVAVDHRARSLARALGEELSIWDRGGRDSLAIADHWRARLAPAAVCTQLLDSVGVG